MENEYIKHFPNKRIRKKSRRKWYYTVSTTMAAIVVFCTVYALILPAITLEKKQNDAAPVADTSDGETWGYNDDGSAWWIPTASLTQITAIQEDTPYVIAGFQGNNLMGDEIFEKDGSSYLKAIPKESVTDYTSYQRWYFERAEGDKCYYIYYLAADNSTKQYLRFAGAGAEEWGKIPQQIALSDDKAQASVFTVERVGDISPLPSDAAWYPDHIAISVVVDDVSYYINSYYGDKPGSDNLTTHWWGYPEISGGSALKICQFTSSKQTANRVETASSPNTVINLFDYWLSDEESDRYNPDNYSPNMDAGINKNHDFKFSHGDEKQIAVNKWVGDGKNPLQGVVANTLTDGFPVLSGNESVNGTPSTESLAYLFDPTIAHPGKASYRNVGGLLTIDPQGYYAYDCKVYAAEFDKETHSFNVYDKPAAGGQFFPFNKTPEIMSATRTDPKINHYFGVTITSRFVQQHNGHTDDRHGTPTTFEFSGDDDVWIFIDGVLVGDVGGIHNESHVSIDFATGEVEVGVNRGIDEKITTTLQKCYQDAGKYNPEEWTTTENGHTIYKDGTVHTLRFFYLERGNYDSNMKLKYNLTEIPKTAIYKVDQYGEEVKGATFAVYAANE